MTNYSINCLKINWFSIKNRVIKLIFNFNMLKEYLCIAGLVLAGNHYYLLSNTWQHKTHTESPHNCLEPMVSSCIF